MRCPSCGRQTPNALMICRHCGADTRPSLFGRLWGWVRRAAPKVTADVGRGLDGDDDAGVRFTAARVKTSSVELTDVTTRETLALDELGPALRAKVLDAINAGGGEVKFYERTEREDSDGTVTVSERGAPVDPALRAAIERLVQAHPDAKTEREIVVEMNGNRQVYQSIDDLPPDVRKLLGRFAESEIGPDKDL